MLEPKINRIAKLTVFGLLVLIAGFSSNVVSKDKVYTVGVVPQFETSKTHTIWRPILSYLEEETGYKFKLRGSSTIPAFESEFMNGDFDFAYMNPYHMMLAQDRQGYIPLIRDTGRQLHGVLVVRKDSGITDVKQLDGAYIAYPAPNALGASLMIRQELQDEFKIETKNTYVKTHDSVYLNVLLGKAKAGGGVQKTLSRQPEKYRDALTVLHTTKKVAPHPLAAHPRVEKEVYERIQKALLKLGESKEGAEILSKIPIKKIGVATMEDYTPLRKLGLDRFYVRG